MVKLSSDGVYLVNGSEVLDDTAQNSARIAALGGREAAREGTIARRILRAHNTSGSDTALKIKFDAMTSHDITYVGIVQTARASGLTRFPIPYVLTNCHNSLCAVGGTINEDDHVFGLSAAKKYGGIYVPPHLAVIHTYMREMMAACGKMILGSDSHTRYGALGTMAIGEGGPELVKQLLCKTYDIDMPEIVAVRLTGSPRAGVGPQDVALAIIGAVFKSGYVKNKVLEFVGEGVHNLSVEYRCGIDVMTTETTCLSSVWVTDERVREYFAVHGREDAYEELKPLDTAYYDGMAEVDLSSISPMIALPFHPSNVYTIDELNANLGDILRETELAGARQLDAPGVSFRLTDKITDGKLLVQQGIIAGCAGGTFENIVAAADIMAGKSIGNGEFSMSVYPGSQPVYMELVRGGSAAKLMEAGVVLKTAFCGPCFGAGDTPANGALSVRHATRNFPSREGSKPTGGQIASVALMDARSIAATAVNGGVLTSAESVETAYTSPVYHFDKAIYEKRVFSACGNGNTGLELKFGPNIADWPKLPPLADDVILKLVCEIHDPVTTTDELIPSGETSSYRSNPLKLAEFTLSRKDPSYVGRTKAVSAAEQARLAGKDPASVLPELAEVFAAFERVKPLNIAKTGIGSAVFAAKPGDGSAREQAASCQRVLGGAANIAYEYATKRYRSNLINWGMLPLLIDAGELPFKNLDYILLPDIRKAVEEKAAAITAYAFSRGETVKFSMSLGELTGDERKIILAGCLINFYSAGG